MATLNDHTHPEPLDLALGLAHEIGSLLAATRLHAHLIDGDRAVGELAEISSTIGKLSSRMGSLLAQIRSLLSLESDGAPDIDPVEILDGVQRGIEESCDVRVVIDLDSAAGLPMAAVDPERLHHILLTWIYRALEDSEPKGSIGVSAFARADSIVFAVDDDSELEDTERSALTGRTLLLAAARAILRPHAGRVSTRSLGKGSRIEIDVPAARR